MPEIQMGGHTVRTHGAKVARFHMHDWVILLLLALIDIGLNLIEPFHRFVGEDMMTDMRYPLKGNTVPVWSVPVSFERNRIIALMEMPMVGVSRVDDYWHHWQDVFAGGLLGVTVSSFFYLQFFPSPYDNDGWGPHAYFQMLADSGNAQPVTNGANNLTVQPAELESIYIHEQQAEESPPSSRSTNPMLNGDGVRH